MIDDGAAAVSLHQIICLQDKHRAYHIGSTRGTTVAEPCYDKLMVAIYHWLWHLLPANPMIVRIVQGGSRRARHLAVRTIYLGAMIVLVVLGLLTGGGMTHNATLTDLAKAGTIIFERVAYGQVILICLLSPIFMAGAIAAERSGKTYEILLSTPMSNMQIVLGTLFGRLFFVLALLASGIPLFAVLLIFGGVPTKAVFISFATAALTALTVGAVAVTLSTMRTGGRKAIFVFVIAVAGYLAFSFVLDVLVLRRLSAGTTWLTPLHPLLVLEASLNSANYRPPGADAVAGLPRIVAFYRTQPFAAFAALSMLVSAALVTWCAIRLRAVGQGEGRWRTKLRKLMRLPQIGAERSRPPRAVWHNPVAWREASTRGRMAAGIIARWGFAVFALLAGGVLLGLYHFNNLPALTDASGALLPPHIVFRNALLTLLLLELAVVVMVAIYMSAGCISREREDGTLDLMLTTPITPKAYIWGKLRGLVSFLTLLLAVPVLTLAMVSLYTIIGKAAQWPGATVMYGAGAVTRATHLLLPEAPLLVCLMLVPFVAVCAMTGMSWSIKSKGVMGAVVPALGFIGVASFVLGLCGWSAAANVPVIGPIINAFSPATNLVMILDPWQRIGSFVNEPVAGRVVLFIAALAAAGGYGLIVYSLLMGIVKNFDQTVRRLSGTG